MYALWYNRRGVISVPLKYDKLFALMKSNGLTTYRIRKEKIISERTLQALRENRTVTTEAIENLCAALKCQPGDLMEYIEDDEN